VAYRDAREKADIRLDRNLLQPATATRCTRILDAASIPTRIQRNQSNRSINPCPQKREHTIAARRCGFAPGPRPIATAEQLATQHFPPLPRATHRRFVCMEIDIIHHFCVTLAVMEDLSAVPGLHQFRAAQGRKRHQTCIKPASNPRRFNPLTLALGP